jgi:hypothetical protein
MKKIILHIGHHKTGSTAIQKFLHKNKDKLAQNEILYPYTGSNGAVAHHAIRQIIESGDKASIEVFRESLVQESHDFSSLVLSSENLSRMKVPGDLIKTLNFAEEFEIVFYLRDPMDYFMSAYRQRIQATKDFISFEEYIHNRNLRYRELSELWKATSTNLVLGLYERNSLIEGDVVKDFLIRTGMPLQSFESYEANPSIHGPLLILKLFLNQFPENSKKKSNLYTFFEKCATQIEVNNHDFCLSKSIQDKIVGQCSNDYEYLQDVFEQYTFFVRKPCVDFHLYTKEMLYASLVTVMEEIHELFGIKLEVVGEFDFANFDSLNSNELRQRLDSCFKVNTGALKTFL